MSVFDVGAYQSDVNPHLHVAEITYIFSLKCGLSHDRFVYNTKFSPP
jgi:hypothetical protein